MQQKDDVQLFDVDVQGRVPAPRDCHASALLGNKGYISGGMVSWLALALLPCSSSALRLLCSAAIFHDAFVQTCGESGEGPFLLQLSFPVEM